VNKTGIDWADMTWNPITGCTPVSEGCENCYAKRMAETRLRGRVGYSEKEPFKVTEHLDRLEEPLKIRKPQNNLYSNWEIGPFWEVKVSMFESKFIVKDLSKHKVNWLLLELLSLGLIKKNSVEISNLNYLELERKYRRLVKKRRFLRVIFRFL